MNRIRTIGIREQSAWLRNRHPDFQCQVKNGLLICRGHLQPSPVSATYAVVIQYRVGTWPEVFVPSDQLQPLESGGRIPHTYGRGRPCLFYPSRESWRSDMKLADKIVPWLSLWLSYYEMWRATGEWFGGGISHGDIKEIEPAA